MLTKTSMLTLMLAAMTTNTKADIFSWFMGSGFWEDPSMWNGPVGQYPDSILDSATISGNSTDAQLSQNLAIGSITVLDGATVLSSSNSIFVSNDTVIDGVGSHITVTPSGSLRDFDTDTLDITEGTLVMYGGLAQIDDWMRINGTGGVLGTGTIEMNSTTGDLVFNGGGALWALGGSGPNDTLLITRTDTSTSRLDWTAADSAIIVWDERTLINELPYTGALGGHISLSSHQGPVRFESTNAFVGGNGSEFRFYGDNSDEARMVAPAVDMYGDILASSDGIIEAPIIALRGSVDISQEATLSLTSGLTSYHAVQITGGDNTMLNPGGANGGTVNIQGGLTQAIMGDSSVFDLDGSGVRTLNIDDGSTLWIQAQYLDGAINDEVTGTMNIDGELHIEAVNGATSWPSAADINLDGGVISGRTLINTGTIQGTGTVDAIVVNNGEIIADGGTLQLGFVSEDGDTTPALGIIRAETGDLVMNMQANGALHYFTGQAFVGDGNGVREVFQSNVEFFVREQDGATGSLSLNSGFCVFQDFSQYGVLNVDGASMIRTTGDNDADRISFLSQSVNTINGTLEVDGRTWIVPGAQFIGSGSIDSVSTIKGIYLQDNADLGGISLASSGPIYLTDVFDSQASVHSLTMRDTASLNMSMWYSQQQAQIVSDKLSVQDHATLSGDLVLTNDPETDLPVGETVTILQADSIDGDFDSVDFSGLGPNRRAFVSVDSDSVDVFITCFADLNADGNADFFDASSFIILYQAEDPMADLNNDGDFNFFDVSVFLSAYDMGC